MSKEIRKAWENMVKTKEAYRQAEDVFDFVARERLDEAYDIFVREEMLKDEYREDARYIWNKGYRGNKFTMIDEYSVDKDSDTIEIVGGGYGHEYDGEWEYRFKIKISDIIENWEDFKKKHENVLTLKSVKEVIEKRNSKKKKKLQEAKEKRERTTWERLNKKYGAEKKD